VRAPVSPGPHPHAVGAPCPTPSPDLSLLLGQTQGTDSNEALGLLLGRISRALCPAPRRALQRATSYKPMHAPPYPTPRLVPTHAYHSVRPPSRSLLAPTRHPCPTWSWGVRRTLNSCRLPPRSDAANTLSTCAHTHQRPGLPGCPCLPRARAAAAVWRAHGMGPLCALVRILWSPPSGARYICILCHASFRATCTRTRRSRSRSTRGNSSSSINLGGGTGARPAWGRVRLLYGLVRA
jgi:hypothetical protein